MVEWRLSLTHDMKVQADLDIRGFDYSRSQKPRENRRHFKLNLVLKEQFWYLVFQIYQQRNPRKERGKPV